MTEHDAGSNVARLLLPYRRRFSWDEDPPDHESGWWFAGAPPDAVSEALSLVCTPPDERPNDQPPEGWLVAQAKARHGAAGRLRRARRAGQPTNTGGRDHCAVQGS